MLTKKEAEEIIEKYKYSRDENDYISPEALNEILKQYTKKEIEEIIHDCTPTGTEVDLIAVTKEEPQEMKTIQLTNEEISKLLNIISTIDEVEDMGSAVGESMPINAGLLAHYVRDLAEILLAKLEEEPK